MSLPCPCCGASRIDDRRTVEMVEVVLASAEQEGRGLLGIASIIVGPIRIDGITIRTSVQADLLVVLPSWRFLDGRLQAAAIPIDQDVVRCIQGEVLGEYRAARRHAGLDVD